MISILRDFFNFFLLKLFTLMIAMPFIIFGWSVIIFFLWLFLEIKNKNPKERIFCGLLYVFFLCLSFFFLQEYQSSKILNKVHLIFSTLSKYSEQDKIDEVRDLLKVYEVNFEKNKSILNGIEEVNSNINRMKFEESNKTQEFD